MTPEQITEIADNLDFGFKCYVHKQSKKIISFPEDSDSDLPEWTEASKEVARHTGEYAEITRPVDEEAYSIMEEFSESITDQRIRMQVERALSNPKPFRYFRATIEDAGDYREAWYGFKRKHLVEHIGAQLSVLKLCGPA